MNTLLVALLLATAERKDQILIQGINQGSQTVAPQGPDSARAEFSFNDRGRGDHIIATWKLDAAGVPIEYSGSGNDYMKSPVSETFNLSGGKAKWHSRSEQGEIAVKGESFYIPANPPPEFMGVLARALLKSPHHALPLLPAGEAHITAVGTSGELTLYHITGLDFSPTPIWLDHDGNMGASISGWVSVVPTARVATVGKLTTEQSKADTAWAANLAKQLTHIPTGDLLIRNARVFDPRDLSVTPGTSVLVRTGHIVRVSPDTAMKAAQGAEVIDAHGRFLMPGLWDNHQHFSGNDGPLDLANGITSARDMANDLDEFPARVARYDAGTELGPRVFKAGIIDGTGPLAGPTRMRVDTPAEALKDVAWYADHGYGQIKIYSSVKPELVPLIADAAHARGLRVSGHVPAFMSAQMFVEAGADELQHLNFIVLNFLFDQVKDTRGTARFTAVGEHAHELGPDNPKVQAFVRFLKVHHTVLDPTLSIFESMFSGDPAGPPLGLEKIVPRFPAQVRRNQLSGALAVPKDQEAAYKEAFPAMLRLLKMLSDAGITIVPGTDALSGYTLLHELELYARAGIPPAQVLRMATLTSAQVVGADRERGTIAAGKLADMVLIDGDPTARIEDIHNATLVFKGGNIYQPAQIETALGIAPK
ncbi:MAG: amidohydrolase family protein [Proteobacteria bacterium]|nr:amidohydrolase family protein [Pseudomonadota bacterium]